MALVITKKTRTILLIVLSVLVIGGGGFLIWRVTQEESVAPGDSDAAFGDGDEVGGSTYDPDCTITGDCYYVVGECVGTCTNGNWKYCSTCDDGGGDDGGGGTTPTKDGTEQGCDYITNQNVPVGVPGESCGTEECGGPCGNFTYKCGYRCYLGGCGASVCGHELVDMIYRASTGGTVTSSQCSSLNCSSTITSTRVVHKVRKLEEASRTPTVRAVPADGYTFNKWSDGKTTASRTDVGGHGGLNVLASFTEVPGDENICEGGNWVARPSGGIPYGTSLNPITINTTDADGLGDVIVAKVNGNDLPNFDDGNVPVGASYYVTEGNKIKIWILPGQQYIPVGNYGITVEWEDGEGNAGDNCKLQTTFQIEEVDDPICSARAQVYTIDETEWSPSEVGFCKVGSTATPSYATLSDSFPAPGETVTWVCTSNLDSTKSVNCEASRATADEPICSARAQVYAYDETEWSPSEVGFCKVGSTATPSYDQLSASFPAPGETVTWVCTSNVDPTKSVNCQASRIDGGGGIPQTGIFDTVLGRVSVGVSFIFLGGLVTQYSRINYFFNSISERNQFRREVKQQRRKEKVTSRRRERLESRFKKD